MTTHQNILALLLVGLLLTGCGGEELPPGMPKLYPATITVMQDGKPLADAQIICLNVDPSVSWAPGGMTDANGVVKLRTQGRYNGAPAGTYSVSVSKVEEVDANTFYIVDPAKFSIDKTQIRIEVSPSNLKFEIDVSPAVRIKVPTSPGG